MSAYLCISDNIFNEYILDLWLHLPFNSLSPNSPQSLGLRISFADFFSLPPLVEKRLQIPVHNQLEPCLSYMHYCSRSGIVFVHFKLTEPHSMFIRSQVLIVELCYTYNPKQTLRHVDRRVSMHEGRVGIFFNTSFIVATTFWGTTFVRRRWSFRNWFLNAFFEFRSECCSYFIARKIRIFDLNGPAPWGLLWGLGTGHWVSSVWICCC